jgi:transposase
LEKVPARLKVIRHVRPRYACRSCEAVLQAPAPDLTIERGRPGPGLLAHVLVSKYLDGLPGPDPANWSVRIASFSGTLNY